MDSHGLSVDKYGESMDICGVALDIHGLSRERGWGRGRNYGSFVRVFFNIGWRSRFRTNCGELRGQSQVILDTSYDDIFDIWLTFGWPMPNRSGTTLGPSWTILGHASWSRTPISKHISWPSLPITRSLLALAQGPSRREPRYVSRSACILPSLRTLQSWCPSCCVVRIGHRLTHLRKKTLDFDGTSLFFLVFGG